MNRTLLPRSTPERQGVASESIMDFVQAIEEERLELHSLMVVRNGCVVAEGWWAPYRAEYPHLLNSLSKSITSTAIGLAVQEGHLSLDHSVLSFFPERVTEAIAANMKGLKVRHLLSMSTGHSQDTTRALWENGVDWVKAFLEIPIDREPGTHFLYNTGASYMLSAVLEKATGQKLLDYLRPRLFEPLGIDGVSSPACPQGTHVGGYGMSLTTEAIAKFGLLYLQEGIWEGKRILSEQWVREATGFQVANGDGGQDDWSQGYGYQFWRCRHDAYRGDGAFGQFCVVLPKRNTVIAITAGLMEMQAVLDRVWQHLLPGLADGELPSSPRHAELIRKLGSLSHLPAGDAGSSPADWRSGTTTYALAPNRTNYTEIGFAGDEEEVRLSFSGEGGTEVLRAGLGSFREGRIELAGFSFAYGASARWSRSNVLEVTMFMTEYPLCDKLVCHFVNDSVQVSSSRNVWLAPILSDMALLPTLVGSKFRDRDTWIGITKEAE